MNPFSLFTVNCELPKYAPNDYFSSISAKYNKLIGDHECILANIRRSPNKMEEVTAYIRAGPRAKLHFDPATVNAAIVTCGGLCPGLNNVVREITRALYHLYGISGKVYGVRGGYKGFYDKKVCSVWYDVLFFIKFIMSNFCAYKSYTIRSKTNTSCLQLNSLLKV